MNTHFSFNLAFINAAQHMHLGEPDKLTQILNFDSDFEKVHKKDVEQVLIGNQKLKAGWFEQLRYWNAEILDVVQAIMAPTLKGHAPDWKLIETHVPKVMIPYVATLISLELPGDANLRLDTQAFH